MDKLDVSANLMLVSDLDDTLVDHRDPDNLTLLRFNALWESTYRQNSVLIFSTGRSLTHYKTLRKEKLILTPDITITSVGTEISYGEEMVPDEGWIQLLSKNWDRNVVLEETAKFPELVPQYNAGFQRLESRAGAPAGQPINPSSATTLGPTSPETYYLVPRPPPYS